MAKEAKPEKSKSDHVREFLAANPKMGGKAVQEALAAKGVDVSIPLVNKVKYSKPSDGAATAVAGRRGRPAGANGNMSEDIRSYMESNPAATRPQIRDAMHASGHKVSTSLVNSVFLRVRAKAERLDARSCRDSRVRKVRGKGRAPLKTGAWCLCARRRSSPPPLLPTRRCV